MDNEYNRVVSTHSDTKEVCCSFQLRLLKKGGVLLVLGDIRNMQISSEMNRFVFFWVTAKKTHCSVMAVSCRTTSESLGIVDANCQTVNVLVYSSTFQH